MVKKILLVILFLGLLFFGFSALLKSKLSVPLSVEQPQLFTVEQGETVHSIANKLQQTHWIDSSFWLKLAVKLKPELGKIKKGTYYVESKTSLIQFIHQLNNGIEYQFPITFAEGLTFKQWLNIIKNTDHLTDDLKNWPKNKIVKELGLTYNNPEGLFFPDTYLFTNGTKASAILLKAHKKMMNLLNEQWQQREIDLPYKSPYEALTLASIIEKETALIEEQPLIAAVFINRLKKGMRLQTDPTVIYGLGDKFTGDITRKNLKQKTPYNTYRIKGLPPTPIAMPGKSAIYATLHPASTDVLYFVSMGNGRHIFSTNHADHVKAVNKYQKKHEK